MWDSCPRISLYHSFDQTGACTRSDTEVDTLVMGQ